MAISTVSPQGPSERELHIEIYPRGHDEWTGTRAQFEAEGLTPDGFEWPKGVEHADWESGPFTCWLMRQKPDGFKGPRKDWLECDNWWLRRTLTSQGRDGYAAARIYEKRIALAEELSHRTPEARRQWSLYWKSREDGRYQAFRAIFVPEPKKRGRVRKATGGEALQDV